MLLAYWLRDPLIPYAGESPRASGFSADSARAADASRRRETALRAMTAAIRASHSRLAILATRAMTAPATPTDAFGHLRSLTRSSDEGVIVFDNGRPVAWAGQMRKRPSMSGTGTTVTFTDFYTTLQVVIEKGARQVVASSVIHAEPPAGEIATALEERLDERRLVAAFRFSPPSDSAAGILVESVGGHPLMRMEATPLSGGQVRFAAAAAVRARGVVILGVLAILMLAVGWSDRRKLGRRLFTIVAAASAVASCSCRR